MYTKLKRLGKYFISSPQQEPKSKYMKNQMIKDIFEKTPFFILQLGNKTPIFQVLTNSL